MSPAGPFSYLHLSGGGFATVKNPGIFEICWLFRAFLAMLLALCNYPQADAIDEFGDLQTLSRLPLTAREVESAFRTSRANVCEIIPAGEPLEISSFTTILTSRDRRESQKKRVLIPSSRRNLFSVGLEFEARDQAALPALCAGPLWTTSMTIICRSRAEFGGIC